MNDFEEQEDVRPAFTGEERYGTYMHGVFVPLDAPTENTSLLKSLEFTKSQLHLHTTQVPKAKYYSPNQRNVFICNARVCNHFIDQDWYWTFHYGLFRCCCHCRNTFYFCL